MTSVRVESFTISLDGYGAGPDQSLDDPLGVGGTQLHQWLLPTRTLQRTLFGKDGGSTGVDDDFAARGFQNVGAWILGRNMFAPSRGEWQDNTWKGWWGDDPPYHVPVFILTHHARPPIEMEGGTTFHFVTGGIHEALERARDAAGGKDVRIGGGANTIRQYLREGLIDELHIAVAPVLLGRGEPLLQGLDLRALGYECVQFVASDKATHAVLRRHANPAPEQASAQGMPRKITVETSVHAPIDRVWAAWNDPRAMEQWNAASPDWHTPRASVDLREGGKFCARMQARGGSVGFDFEGTYTRVAPQRLIEYTLGDGRKVRVEFTPLANSIRVRESFDAEESHSAEQQRQGWQAILDNFARYVEHRA